MPDEKQALDLFGQPFVAPSEKCGRPQAVWTPEGSNLVLLAFAAHQTVKFAADLVGMSQPTFRREYISECALRKLAAHKHDFHQLALLAAEAAQGNVGASKELDRRLEKLRLQALGARLPEQRKNGKVPQREAKLPPMGKKEEQQHAAQGISGRFSTRPAPPSLVN